MSIVQKIAATAFATSAFIVSAAAQECGVCVAPIHPDVTSSQPGPSVPNRSLGQNQPIKAERALSECIWTALENAVSPDAAPISLKVTGNDYKKIFTMNGAANADIAGVNVEGIVTVYTENGKSSLSTEVLRVLANDPNTFAYSIGGVSIRRGDSEVSTGLEKETLKRNLSLKTSAEQCLSPS